MVKSTAANNADDMLRHGEILTGNPDSDEKIRHVSRGQRQLDTPGNFNRANRNGLVPWDITP